MELQFQMLVYQHLSYRMQGSIRDYDWPTGKMWHVTPVKDANGLVMVPPEFLITEYHVGHPGVYDAKKRLRVTVTVEEVTDAPHDQDKRAKVV